MPTDLDNGECLLDHLPFVIGVHFPVAPRTVGKLHTGVYPLTSKTCTRKVHKYAGIESRRAGYLLVPDFGSTAHMIKGATFDAAFWGSQDVSSNVSMTSQISGYVVLTRVTKAAAMCIFQPFFPVAPRTRPAQGS